jgi:fermentation-respiration switch protein FrsA (DUF1100 family)
MHILPEPAGPLFFPGMPESEAVELARQLKTQSTASFLDKPTYAAVDHVPVTYIHTTKDTIVPVEYQQAWVEMLKQRNGKKVSTVSIDEEHYAPKLVPEGTARAIVDAVTKE